MNYISTVPAYKYSLPKGFHGLVWTGSYRFVHSHSRVQCELELTRKAQIQLTPHIALCLTRCWMGADSMSSLCSLWLSAVCARAG